MDYKDRVDTYTKLIKKNGAPFQVSKVIEELSELIVELSKVGQNKVTLQKVCDELADVRIGVEQVEHIFKLHEAVEMTMDYKIKRVNTFELEEKDTFE